MSSRTSCKQLNRESDARFVGYFGAVGEGALALGAIIAATAGFATAGEWDALCAAFGAGGLEGTGGLLIWPLFGTTNQLLAALTLMIISLMVLRAGRPVSFALIPMVLILGVTVVALFVQLAQFYRDGNWFLLGLDLVVLIAAVLVVLEVSSAMSRGLRERNRR